MKLKISKSKNLFSIFTLFILFSCNPEQPKTDFNVLVEVPNGSDMNLETREDEDLTIEYSVEPLSESVDLILKIMDKPKYGDLKDCESVNSFSIRCTYTPKKNFNGKDQITFITKDGELRGRASSTLTINVVGEPDSPVAIDGSFKTKAMAEKKFKFPNAIDPDSKAKDLKFEIVSYPQNGRVTNCKNNYCYYQAERYFEGIDSFTYRVIDNGGLSSEVATMRVMVSSDLHSGMETFTQGVNSMSGVDILWVIDNSGSMKNEQESLAANFEAFIENFMANGKAKFPFKMGVITTDKYLSNGKNLLESDDFGSPYNLTSARAESDFAGFKSDFQKAVNVGINGSGAEKVFDSIENFNKLNPAWANQPQKLLTYILLTDEKEQSSGKISKWVSYFNNLKDESWKTKIFPVISLQGDSEQRFSKISSASGTRVYDIESRFNSVLDSISLSVSQNLSSFKLKEGIVIKADTINVKVDGVDVRNFKYENNTIKLLEAPGAYATIVVTYKYGGY